MKTLYEYILTATKNYKNSTALVQNSKHLSYKNLLQKIILISDQLILEGLHKGDKIIINLKNPLNQFIASIAIIRAGGVAVPIGQKADSSEWDLIIKNVDPFTIITDPRSSDINQIKQFNFPHSIFYWSEELFKHIEDSDYIENIEHFENESAQKITRLIQPEISDLVFIHYASETKKLIAFNHIGIIYPSLLLNQILSVNPSHRELITYSPSHILGFIRIIQNLIAGVTSFLIQDIEDKLNIPAYIMKHKCNTLFTDIELFNYLCSNFKSLTMEALKNIIILQLSGDNIYSIDELVKQGLSDLQMTKVYLSYSPLEAPLTTIVNIKDVDPENLCMGLPLPGIKLKIQKQSNVDNPNVGILCINGNNTMEGYFKDGNIDKSNFSADNWLITNQYAMLDEKGKLYLKGTKEDVMFINKDIISLQEINALIGNILSELNCEYYLTFKENIYEPENKVPILFYATGYAETIEPEKIYEKISSLEIDWLKNLLIFKVKEIPKSGNKVIKNELFKQIDNKDPDL